MKKLFSLIWIGFALIIGFWSIFNGKKISWFYIICAVAFYTVSIFIYVIWTMIDKKQKKQKQKDRLKEFIFNKFGRYGPVIIIIAFLIVIFFAAAFEEAVFRFPLLWLNLSWDLNWQTIIGIFVSSFLFAQWHRIRSTSLLFGKWDEWKNKNADKKYLTHCFFVGIILSVLIIKTRNLLNPIIVHTIVNLIAMLPSAIERARRR